MMVMKNLRKVLQHERAYLAKQICCAPCPRAHRGSHAKPAHSRRPPSIILGGGIGAIIDHNKGTAYTYPQWIRLVVGKILGYDSTKDKDGMPNLGTEVVPTATTRTSMPDLAVNAGSSTLNRPCVLVILH